MIEVQELTKRYGLFEALRFASFKIEKGEAVGLLGANGAGKTTTMRILSCFLPPTSGTVLVAGKDVVRESMEVRRRIGYLPENVPVYGAMRVEEFLRFRARLKGLDGATAKSRTAEVMSRVDLTARRRSLVQNLSKGLRQRVGFADALVHDPEVLILDEPTSGLDPSQRVEVRRLLAELRGRHTLLISSHILPEIESVCERVVILRQGTVVAQSPIGALKGESARFVVEGAFSSEEAARKAIESVRAVADFGTPGIRLESASLNEGIVVLEFSSGGQASDRSLVVKKMLDLDFPIMELRSKSASLEDAYMKLLRGGDGEK